MAAVDTWLKTGEGLPVLETPLLKVSRPVAACTKCRAAKIKCDGRLPACSACEKAGKGDECASTNAGFARGKERSYVATLETRVERLERRLQQVQGRTRPDSGVPDGSVVDQAASVIDRGGVDVELAAAAAAPALRRSAMRQEARDVDELVSGFGYLTVNATSRDYHGFTSFMSYARLVLAACSKDRLAADVELPLPARHMVTAAVQRYMDDFYILLPFFEPSTIFSSVNAVCAAQQSRSSHATDFDHWCVRLVLAITNAASSRQRGDEPNLEAVGHASVAMAHAEAVLRPGTITVVQSLLFLIQYALLDPHHFDAWELVGAASRAMIDLGFHQDPPRVSTTSRSNVHLRRRIFHCVYVLDRSAAINQARAFSFSDDSTLVANPFLTQPSVGLGGFSGAWAQSSRNMTHLIQLRRTQSRWYQDLFQSGRETYDDPYGHIWRIYGEVEIWHVGSRNASPPWLRDLFELEALYSLIYILGPTPRTRQPVPYAQVLLFEHCISYAARLEGMLTSADGASRMSFDDTLRTLVVGMRLLGALRTSRDLLTSGLAPEPPRVAAAVTDRAPLLPPMTVGGGMRIMQAVSTIKSIQESLRIFSTRWGLTSWHDEFALAADPILIGLDSRSREMQQETPHPLGWTCSLPRQNPSQIAAGSQDSRRESNTSDASQSTSRAMHSSRTTAYSTSPYDDVSDTLPPASRARSSISPGSGFLDESSVSPTLSENRPHHTSSMPLLPSVSPAAHREDVLRTMTNGSSTGYGGALSPSLRHASHGQDLYHEGTPSPRSLASGGTGQSGPSQQYLPAS